MNIYFYPTEQVNQFRLIQKFHDFLDRTPGGDSYLPDWRYRLDRNRFSESPVLNFLRPGAVASITVRDTLKVMSQLEGNIKLLWRENYGTHYEYFDEDLLLKIIARNSID